MGWKIWLNNKDKSEGVKKQGTISWMGERTKNCSHLCVSTSFLLLLFFLRTNFLWNTLIYHVHLWRQHNYFPLASCFSFLPLCSCSAGHPAATAKASRMSSRYICELLNFSPKHRIGKIWDSALTVLIVEVGTLQPEEIALENNEEAGKVNGRQGKVNSPSPPIVLWYSSYLLAK